MAKTTKKKNTPTPKRTWKQRIFRVALQLSFLLVVALSLFILSIKMGFYGKLPSAKELRAIENMKASEVYSADGKLLGKFFLQDRSAVKFNEISPNVIDALVATEDARFYDHNGIDYRSLVRVLFRTIIMQDRRGGGGSTITQQLVKNVYGRQQHEHLSMPITKIKEMMTAYQLEKVYSKEQIITLYLNTVPFGDNTFGIESAAQRFFSTSTKNLTVPQAATLIGMLKANYTYNPRLFPDKSKFRRNVVINQMHKYDFLTEKEAANYNNQLLDLKYRRITQEEGIATYFREQVRQRAEAWCKANKKWDGTHYNLYTDGLKIHTTLDTRIQRYAEKAMKQHMASLQKVFNNHIEGKEPWLGNNAILQRAMKGSARYQQMKKEGATDEQINKAFNTKTTMDIFTWQGEKEVQITPMDSIKHYLSFLNTGFLAIDPKTGKTKAWVGGIDFKYFKYDHVNHSTRRQVGSTFKPIVYAAALEKGIEPCEHIPAERTTYENFGDWTPSNGEDNYHLKYSMKGALTKSVNTVAVNLLDQTGIKRVVKLAESMGVKNELPAVPSLALGTANISVSELASVYSTFVNDGVPVMPYTIERIEDSNREIVYENTFKEQERAISGGTCALMIDMMKNVVDSGTARRLRRKYNLPNELAGKTGTTQDNADGWFASITPNLVMISWVGADHPQFRFRSTALGQGANTALPITALFLKSVNSDDELSYISKAKFSSLSYDLTEAMDCVDAIEDTNFIEKIFGKSDDPVKKEFGDSTKAKKKNLRDRIKGIFKRKKD